MTKKIEIAGVDLNGFKGIPEVAKEAIIDAATKKEVSPENPNSVVTFEAPIETFGNGGLASWTCSIEYDVEFDGDDGFKDRVAKGLPSSIKHEMDRGNWFYAAQMCVTMHEATKHLKAPSFIDLLAGLKDRADSGEDVDSEVERLFADNQ